MQAGSGCSRGTIICVLPVSAGKQKSRDLKSTRLSPERLTTSSGAISCIVFACVFGGALLGMYLRSALPREHLTDDSKDAMKVAMGLIATMCALILGLLVTSAKSSYDAQNTDLQQVAAKVVLLDRFLAHYGPETKETRDVLRSGFSLLLDRLWSNDKAMPVSAEVLLDKIQELSPKDDSQRSLKTEALGLTFDLAQTRWLQFEQVSGAVPMPLLVMLVFWLTTLFIGLGLLTPLNRTMITCLLVSALTVSSAIFLTLSFCSPYAGLIRVSSAPLRAALAQLGK
jgi:hypothetical protein